MSLAQKKLRKNMEKMSRVEETAKRAYDQGKICREAYEELVAAGLADKRVSNDGWANPSAPLDGTVQDSVDDVVDTPTASTEDDQSPALAMEETATDEKKPECNPSEGYRTSPAAVGWSAAGGELEEKDQSAWNGRYGSTIDICSTGGLLLDMPSEDGAKMLRVSCQILTAASSVMAEKIRGLSWLKRKSGELLRLELLNEDQGTMEIICNATHFRTSRLPAILTPEDLVRVGRISEKYDFREALRPWSTIWLQKALTKSDLPGLTKLLEAARLLDAWVEYSEISFDLVRLQVRPFQHGMGISADTIAYLEERRLSMASDAMQVIDKAVSQLVLSSVSGADRVKMLWVQSLKDCELWPLAVGARGRSAEGILSVMEAIQGPAATLKAGEPCGCRESTLDVAKTFRTSRDSVYREKAGVCLDCVVSHGKLMEGGRCRLDLCEPSVEDRKPIQEV